MLTATSQGDDTQAITHTHKKKQGVMYWTWKIEMTRGKY